MPSDVSARIARHQALNAEHFLLTLEAPAIARRARPGQFVMLQTRPGYEPLLRRPMSIYRIVPGRRGLIQVLYKVVGRGTRYLARQRTGESLATLGPLGNGFKLPRSGARVLPVLVAGGIGIAIFPFLADALRARQMRPILLFGGRSRRDLVSLTYFRAARVGFRLASEDGSTGVRGFVTRLLAPMLVEPGLRSALRLYVCGPTPMLKAVGDLAADAGVRCQLALEAQMPCGIGVCLGCVVPCPGGVAGPIYRRVCTEGPVFRPGEVFL
jgi:dihydroorotate dehydrogenase electron transfer subunit